MKREIKRLFNGLQVAIREGGKASDIQLKYGGAEQLQINADGSLSATTPMGAITEQAPHTYQKDGTSITSAFVLQGNILSYSTGSYAGDIVIDPSLVWATYYGGSTDDFGYYITDDKKHHLYLTGWTASVAGIATSGAYQETYGGNPYDAFLAKFNTGGMPIWATYFGGSGYDIGLSLTTDTAGNVFMSGCTNSTSVISTVGSYQPVMGGYYDGFLAEFNSAGILQWGTYFGGTAWESGLALKTDRSGNVYMAGETRSASSVATPGAYQTVWGGDFDAFLAKFSGSGVMQWSTYFGGSAEDVGYALVMDTSDNLYMTGYTGSATAIATTGAFQDTYGGGFYDAYLAKISNSGAVLWSTYYGGTGDDQSFAATIDTAGFIYIVGLTSSPSVMATPGAHQTTFGGGSSDAFLSKFDTSGMRLWGTYYGGNALDIAYGVANDSLGNIFISGATGSASAIATAGAYQPVLGGYFDVFLARFSNTGVRKWATYYGGTRNDIASSMITADSNIVYVTGYTSSISGIATPGAYQTTYGGDAYDVFLAKFNFCAIPDVAAIIGLATVCPGETIVLTDSTTGGLWSSTNTTIATVGSTGIVTGVSSGLVAIRYKVSNVCGDSTAMFLVTVASDSICTQGFHAINHPDNGALNISPNPNHGTFTVNLTSALNEKVIIVVTNILGIKVRELITTTNKVTTLQLHEAPGIYMLSASTPSGRYVARLIIK